jgi:hypothetical protein
LKASKQAFRIEQRPYLWPTPRGGFQNKDKNGPILLIFEPLPDSSGYIAAVAVDVVNGGRSPAVNATVSETEFKIGPTADVVEQVKNFAPNYTKMTPEVIASSGSGSTASGEKAGVTAISTPVIVTNEAFAHLNDGTWRFYNVGGIQYGDFSSVSDRPYETTYCYQVSFVGMVFHNCNFGPAKFGFRMK